MNRLLVSFLLVASSVYAQQRGTSDYVRVLLPVLSNGPRANGAVWQARLAMRNDGPDSLDAFPLTADCSFSVDCLRIRPSPAFPAAQDGFGTRGNFPADYTLVVSGSPGVYLYVERKGVDQFSAHLEVSDIAHTPSFAATLPVVQEKDFYIGRHSVVAVPVDPDSRIAVRIYQLDPRAGAAVAVRIYEYGPEFSGFVAGKLLSSATLGFRYDAAFDNCVPQIPCPSVPYHPGYAQILDLVAAMPEIRNSNAITHQLRIEFETGDAEERYWPLVTVTNNTTNAVQVFTVR